MNAQLLFFFFFFSSVQQSSKENILSKVPEIGHFDYVAD